MSAKLPGLTLLIAAAMLSASAVPAQDDAEHFQTGQYVGENTRIYSPGNYSNDPSRTSNQSGTQPRVLSGPTGSSHLNLQNNANNISSSATANQSDSGDAPQYTPGNSPNYSPKPNYGRPTLATPRQPAAANTDGMPSVAVDRGTPVKAPRDNRPLAERVNSMNQPTDAAPQLATPPAPRPWQDTTAQTTPEPVQPLQSSRRAAGGKSDISADESQPLAPLPAKPRSETSDHIAVVPAPGALEPLPEPVNPIRSAPMSLPGGSSSRRAVVHSDSAHSDASRDDAPHVSAPAEIADSASPTGNVLINRQSPQLSVETVGPRTILIGKEAAYKVLLKNSGDAAAQDVVVSVKIPEWTDVAGTQATYGTTRMPTTEGETFQWRLPKLDAHGKEALTLRLVPRKGRAFDLAVQFTFTPVAAQTLVDVQEPKLAMNIAGPDEVSYGQSKLYRLTISNPGTGDAEKVVIELSPIGNSSAPPTRHTLGIVRAGESKVVELELTARQMGTVQIHAAAIGEPALKAEANQEVLVRRAAVALTVDGAKTRYTGTTAAYTIQVSNPGNALAENVRVVAELPQDAKFLSASHGGQCKAEQGKVAWTLSNLKPGESDTVELKCTLMAPGANRLKVSSVAAGDVSDAASVTTHVEALADLKLDVNEPAGPIAVGDDVTYELHVRNRGTKNAEGVGIVAYFSEGIEPLSAEGGPHDVANGVVAFRPLGSLAVGDEIVYKIRARAQQSGKQVFRAEVECGTLGTKLVSAQEAMIYGGEEAGNLLGPDKAIARRNPPPAPMPVGTAPFGTAPIGTVQPQPGPLVPDMRR